MYVDENLNIDGIDDIKSEEQTFTMPECCEPEEGKMYAFYEVPDTWGSGDIYCWCWNDTKNFTGGTWPGVKCTKVGTNANGNAIWKWVGPASTEGKPTGIIFSIKGSPQTSDLEYHEGGYFDYYGFCGTSVSRLVSLTTGSTSRRTGTPETTSTSLVSRTLQVWEERSASTETSPR